MIKKENIKTHTHVRANHGQQQFWNGGQTKKQETRGGENAEPVTLFDKKAAIVKYEIATWAELQGQTIKDIEDLYSLVLLAKRDYEEEEPNDDDVRRMTRNDMIDYLAEQNYQEAWLEGCTEKRLEEMVTKELDKKEETTPRYTIMYGGKSFDADMIEKIRVLLEEENYLSFAKINQMSEYNIVAYYEQFYNTEGQNK